MKTYLLPFLLGAPLLTVAQSTQGYWDNQRVTNKEIQLSRGEKTIVKSEDFPVGTTEFAYRITLLDENQKMVSDLASVLKAIPDPYYIGKGTGSAISLLSTVSGSDKCTYAIFTNEANASDFMKSESTEKACLFQKNPISKDAKVISLKSACLGEETKNIWFTFKNENWMMGEKIVLEIMPWVDNVASRGWTKKNKEMVVKNISTRGLAKMANLEYRIKIAHTIFEEIESKYRFQEFDALSEKEQMTYIESVEEAAVNKSGMPNVYNDYICYKADVLAKNKKIEEAIELLNNRVLAKPNVMGSHYVCLAKLYIESNQFEKALKTLKTAEKLDGSDLKVQMNLAHIYMFMDEVSKSKEIHKQFMNQNVSAKQSWKNKAINDLNDFKKSNLPQKNIDKIWRLYN